MIESDMRWVCVGGENVGDRVEWKWRTRVADLKYFGEKVKEMTKNKMYCFCYKY